MTNERSTHAYHYHRRPPDVEEALSSMLWTPYERPTTDSSTDDENDTGIRGFVKSKSFHDYQHQSRWPHSLTECGHVCYWSDDKTYDPWSDANTINTTVPSINSNEIAARIWQHPRPLSATVSSGCCRNRCYKPRVAPTIPDTNTNSSYAHFQPTFSSLTKWWSTYSSASGVQTPATTTVPMSSMASSSCSATYTHTSVSLSTVSLSTCSSLPAMAMMAGDEQPPSYESLFVQPRKQRHHLHLIRPVWKVLRRTTNNLRMPCHGQHLLMSSNTTATSPTIRMERSPQLTSSTSSPAIMRPTIVNNFINNEVDIFHMH